MGTSWLWDQEAERLAREGGETRLQTRSEDLPRWQEPGEAGCHLHSGSDASLPRAGTTSSGKTPSGCFLGFSPHQGCLLPRLLETLSPSQR